MTKPLEKFATCRLPDTLHKKFASKAKKYGGVSKLLREFIEAFLDDRLTIDKDPKKEIFK